MEEVEIRNAYIYEGHLGEGEDGTKFAIIRIDPAVGNPWAHMAEVVSRYVGQTPHNQFVDITCCDPWTRLIIKDIRKVPLETMGQRKRRLRIESVMSP